MSAPQPLERVLLASLDTQLTADSARYGPRRDWIRLEFLEALACAVGGIRLGDLRRMLRRSRASSVSEASGWARQHLSELKRLPVPAALALSALATPNLAHGRRRAQGVYYTDFRLARYLARRLAPGLPRSPRVVDPSSGSGVLLAALTLEAAAEPGARRSAFIADSVHAGDLSELALHGALISLASLTSDLDAIRSLRRHIRRIDSLLAGPDAWRDVAPLGFDAVIGNPPWEKLKLTRPEFLAATDASLHYGGEYDVRSDAALRLSQMRTRLGRYAERVAVLYPMQVSGEPDLYKAFLELATHLARRGGEIAMLVPAGLIRSHGTAELRRHLFRECSLLDLTVLENRARFFAIDTRFKFLVVHARLDGGAEPELVLRHATGDRAAVVPFAEARLDRAWLEHARDDLTVPEVRGDAEWRLFQRMSERGVPFRDLAAAWGVNLQREVDMTRDRMLFTRQRSAGAAPVIEGRMIHQYRFPAKRYLRGTGREALWLTERAGPREPAPQFWIKVDGLDQQLRARIARERVGFCDITGQTNERSMLAALVPPGVVCGNKVPTLLFADETAAALWLAVANSLPFDWIVRRLITTTMNYFILLSLPFPPIVLGTTEAYRLARLARELTLADRRGGPSADPWSIAELRAEVDLRVLSAFGLGPADLALMLADFPLLDRGQVPLPGEARSTVTADLLNLRAAERSGGTPRDELRRLRGRVDQARALGALPYIPAEFAEVGEPSSRVEVQVG